MRRWVQVACWVVFIVADLVSFVVVTYVFFK
jgi:hypothetical protein